MLPQFVHEWLNDGLISTLVEWLMRGFQCTAQVENRKRGEPRSEDWRQETAFAPLHGDRVG